MLAANLYPIIYFSVVTILTLYCFQVYSGFSETRIKYCNTYNHSHASIILISIITIFIGLRPDSIVFVDMISYTHRYEALNVELSNFEFNDQAQNLIFDNIFFFCGLNNVNITYFYLFISIIYFSGIFWIVYKCFPNDNFYALVVYLGALSTFSYGTNGIKAGAAASLFLMCFVFYRKPLLITLFALLSLGFHHSMTLTIYSFVFAYFIKNEKYFFIFWVTCLFLSTLHLSFFTEFFAELTDEKGQSYLLADEESFEGKTGFRWDFILYSLPPVAIGYWAIYKKHVKDRMYHLLLCTYLVANGIWLLCLYVPFNNRIAYLSWFLLPVLIIYPFLKFRLRTKQYIQVNYIAGMYFILTIFSLIFM